MSQIAINSSQNVKINYNTASVGERIVAFWIDLVIKGAYIVVLYLIFSKILQLKNFFDGLDNWSVGAIVLMITLPIHIYTLVFESILEGQTIGKKIMKIKVVKIDGFQAHFSDYLIRWFMRLIDVFSNFGIIGLISMITSKNNQRLGDMAAGTSVISLKNNINISHTILENLHQDYLPTFPQVIVLTDNDMRIIKENFEKAMKTNDTIIINKISNKIKNILKLETDMKGFTNKKLIQTIIKDYNFYTGKDY